MDIISHAVKAPVAMLGLSNGARSGLTGFVAGLARASAEHNVAARMSLPLGLRHPADNPRLGCCRQLDVLDSAVAKPLSPLACNALTWNGKPWLGN